MSKRLFDGFQWEASNRKHAIEDYPDRGFTTAELESIFNDPRVDMWLDRVVEKGGYKEEEYCAYGKTIADRFVLCIFTVRDGKARIFSARQDRNFPERRAGGKKGKP